MSDLPEGWEETRLGNLGVYINGRGFKSSEWSDSGRPIIRIQNLTGSSSTLNYYKGEIEQRYIVEPGDLLISWSATLGAYFWSGPQGVLNQHIFRVESYINKKFHKYLVDHVLTELMNKTHGSGMVHITRKPFDETPVLLPPLAEQSRIVAAIEEQFSRLDAGVAAFDRARQNIKRMRFAVLQKAVTDALKRTDQAVMPVAKLLSAPLANGRSVPDGPDDGFPVLRLTAVRQGWIDVTCSKRGAWTEAEARPYKIQKGDYLVVRGNGSKHLVGRGAMVGADAEVAYPDTLIRLRFHDAEVLPRYAALIWESPMVRSQIERAARTTAGIYKINQKDLARITFPVPPIEDQERIQASAESALYVLGVLEAQLNSQFLRTRKLRSSILARAFSGKLASQDPSDEPASLLLQRIDAEGRSSNGSRSKRTDRKPQTLSEEVIK